MKAKNLKWIKDKQHKPSVLLGREKLDLTNREVVYFQNQEYLKKMYDSESIPYKVTNISESKDHEIHKILP